MTTETPWESFLATLVPILKSEGESIIRESVEMMPIVERIRVANAIRVFRNAWPDFEENLVEVVKRRAGIQVGAAMTGRPETSGATAQATTPGTTERTA